MTGPMLEFSRAEVTDHRMNPNHAGPVKATLITMLPVAKIKQGKDTN